MRRFWFFIVSLGLFCSGSSGWASPETHETIARIIQRKVPKGVEKIPLDDTHPVILASKGISDLQMQETLLKMCKLFQKDLNLLIGWLVHEVPTPEKIFQYWKEHSQERPILRAGKLWKQEVVSLETLEEYLKNQWRGSPLVVRDDYHLAALRIQENKVNKTIQADFYDPYEPFDQGSFIERRILELLEYKVFPEYTVNWTTHYTKHQKLTAFGECALYASVYRSLLLKGQEPNNVSQEVILEKISKLKEMIREQHPDYCRAYDQIFQFIFDSGFDGLLLEEIKRLPKTWGMNTEPEGVS